MINETIFMTSHSGRAHVIVCRYKYPKCGSMKWKWADIKLITLLLVHSNGMGLEKFKLFLQSLKKGKFKFSKRRC